jgi:hypothetical protein
MKRLLDSNLEIFVDSGFIYLPLLFDPAIETEIQTLGKTNTSSETSGPRGAKTVIETRGKHFVKTLNLESLLANYEKIDHDSYKLMRRVCLSKFHLSPEIDSISRDGKLRTILFRVMPYFIKQNKDLKRRKLGEEEILDLIAEKINIPQRYYEEAKAFLNPIFLQKLLKDVEKQQSIIDPPENGLLSAPKLREWLCQALEAQILASEHQRLKKALQLRQQFSQIKPKHMGILLYVAATGSLEIDGFGFSKTGSNGEYVVYKYTGEYVLKDYYARSYLFPDCRVAVPIGGPFRPVVLETYKHPFLLGHDAGQAICLRNFIPPDQFTADNIIKVLEEGINALLYGYDSRRRNGCHSLDRTRLHVRTIEFDDYRI